MKNLTSLNWCHQLIFPPQIYLKNLDTSMADKQLYQDMGFFPLPMSTSLHQWTMLSRKVLYLTEWNTGDIWLLRLKDSGKLSWRKIISVEGTVTDLAVDWLRWKHILDWQ